MRPICPRGGWAACCFCGGLKRNAGPTGQAAVSRRPHEQPLRWSRWQDLDKKTVTLAGIGHACFYAAPYPVNATVWIAITCQRDHGACTICALATYCDLPGRAMLAPTPTCGPSVLAGHCNLPGRAVPAPTPICESSILAARFNLPGRAVLAPTPTCGSSILAARCNLLGQAGDARPCSPFANLHKNPRSALA